MTPGPGGAPPLLAAGPHEPAGAPPVLVAGPQEELGEGPTGMAAGPGGSRAALDSVAAAARRERSPAGCWAGRRGEVR